jgi:cobaltochelatase CobT
MAGKKFDLARRSALCLSEVLSALHIPHEIVGHTTSDDVGPVFESLAENKETPEDYSRVCPFQGYVFKEFAEKMPPNSVFEGLSIAANLDGEAVLWALERLARRKERTKLCIVICDGMPAAPFSHRDELERHLFTVVKHAEARVHEGLHVCALGIGEERVREFYRNAEVLSKVEDLPQAVLGIVKKIMLKAKAR